MSQSQFAIEIRQRLKAVRWEGIWWVETLDYWYAIHEYRGPEILAFHWHPNNPANPIPFPHLHLEPAVGTRRKELQKAHIPVGWIEVEDIVRFAIEGFGVEPLRTNWDDVLSESRARFFAPRS